MMSAADILAAAAGDLDSLGVVHYPDPRLRAETARIDAVDDNVRAVVDRMFEIMFASQGVGLAAPQVGLSVQLLVASPTFEDSDRLVMMNPTIIAEAGWEEGEEGCLSFPGIYCKVKRRRKIVVKFMDLTGAETTLELDDFPARVIQHELDHLNATLLVDRMGQLAKLSNRKALKDLEARFDG